MSIGALPTWHHRYEPDDVIPDSRKGYNDVAAETFGPLDKYVPANDNAANPEPFGPFIQVYPARKFFPFDPRSEDVHIDSIAHGLSNICRYSGAGERTLSVAEHSVLIARWLVNRYGATTALCGLLHDAPEALSGFGDVGRPVKDRAPIIGKTETNIWRLAVSKRFELPEEIPAEVHEADSRIIADEIAANLAPMEWQSRHNNPLGVRIRCWYPRQACEEFIATFETLMAARGRE